MIVSLEEAKQYLGVTEDDQDELIEGFLTRAASTVERVTGRYFGEPASTLEYLDGTATRYLRLSQPPSSGTPTIERETSPGVWEAEPPGDFQVIGRHLRHNTGWFQGTGNYRVTFTRGFAEGSTDEDYQLARQVVLEQIKEWFTSRDSDGLKSESIGPYSYTAEDASEQGEPSDAMRALRGWIYA